MGGSGEGGVAVISAGSVCAERGDTTHIIESDRKRNGGQENGRRRKEVSAWK